MADRFVSVLLKLKENPELLGMLGSSSAAAALAPARGGGGNRGPAAGSAVAPRQAPADARGGLGTDGFGQVARSSSQSFGSEIGSMIPSTARGRGEAADTPPSRSDRTRLVGAQTPSQQEASANASSATPILSARGMVLREKKGDHLVPTLPDWTRDRPFLTGEFLRLAVESPMLLPMPDKQRGPAPLPISTFPHTVQQVILMEELLSALMGIEGKYVKALVSKGGRVDFRVDIAVDPSIADLMQRILPLACYAHSVERYIEVHSR